MAVGDGKHREYWADREPVRGRYAGAREHPLLVQTLKERIRHRVKLDWPDEDAAGLVTSDPYAPTVVLPRIRHDGPFGAGDQAGHLRDDEEETEPISAIRRSRTWLDPDRFRWSPDALAGYRT
jgi:hypothetical protein